MRSSRTANSTSTYWDLDFPDEGAERRFDDPDAGAAELEHLLRSAVRRRLVGEVPISCYLSGGLDSAVILALSCQEMGRPCRRSRWDWIEPAPATNDKRRPKWLISSARRIKCQCY